MQKQTSQFWQSVFFAILIALIGTNENTFAQATFIETPQLVPVSPNPGRQTNSGFQSYDNATPVFVQPTINTAQYPVVQPVNNTAQYPVVQAQYVQPVRQSAGNDPFTLQSQPTIATTAAPYPGPNYRVAQVPQQQPQPPPSQLIQPAQSPQFQVPQQIPPGLTQTPAYVPQNYAAPVPFNPGFTTNPCQPCYIACPPQPLWAAQGNVLYMTRTKSSSFPLLIDGGGATLFNANELDFGWKTGYDVALSRKFRSGINFELRYFQIDGWTAVNGAPYAVGDAIATNLPTPLIGPGTIDYVSDSSIHSFEMNLINQARLSEKFRLSIGFRWVELSDNLVQTFSPTGSTFDINTNNHLYGLQLGSDGVIFTSAGGGFNVVVWGKSGVYANVGDQSSVVSGGPALYGGPSVANGARKTTASYIGESGLLGDFQLTQCISVIGGYQLIWISGTALAADQLPNMSSALTGLDPTGLDQSGAFYHGAFLGVDVRW